MPVSVPERLVAPVVEAEADRLIERGATYLRDGQQGPHRRITIADPGGYEFCIS